MSVERSAGIIVAIAVGVIALLVSILGVALILRRRRELNSTNQANPPPKKNTYSYGPVPDARNPAWRLGANGNGLYA